MHENNDRHRISIERYENYLEKDFLPYVRKIILHGSNAVKEQTSGFDEFIACLGKSLQNTTVPDEVDISRFIIQPVQAWINKHTVIILISFKHLFLGITRVHEKQRFYKASWECHAHHFTQTPCGDEKKYRSRSFF